MSAFTPQRRSLIQCVRRSVAIQAAVLARFILKRLGRSATSFPGKLAMKIYPQLLRDICAGRKVAMVSGTNGKTTTVLILSALLEKAGYEVFSNRTGANMEDGMLSSLIEQRKPLSESGHPYIILESDEAWFPKLCPKTKPSLCLITNFFRDQLDRYGELNHTRDLIARGLDQCPSDCRFVLCGDDPLSVSLSEGREAQSVFFGLEPAAMEDFRANHLMESKICPRCSELLSYEKVAYAQLGLFHCPHCGFRHPKLELSFTPDAAQGDEGVAEFCFGSRCLSGLLTIPGRHNLYNACGALLAALTQGADFESSVRSLQHIQAAFGRMEEFEKDGRHLRMILIKNPIGAQEALNYVTKAGQAKALFFLLNARENDGRDVSWIWDIDFEAFLPGLLKTTAYIAVSGERAEDMALRLLYAGVPADLLHTESQISSALAGLLRNMDEGDTAYILPNYTAMLSVRALFKKELPGS